MVDSPSGQENAIDQLVNRLSAEGRVDEIEGELRHINPETLSPEEQCSWFHTWGITAFQRGDREEAFRRFQDAHARFPESAVISFSLAQEYEARGEPEQMYGLFDQCLFPDVPAAYGMAAARYAYLWSDHDRATRYVQPILDAYFTLGIVDDTFVYMRGLPFVTEPMRFAIAIFKLRGELDQVRQLIKRAIQKLTGHDLDSLLLEIEAEATKNFTSLCASIREAKDASKNYRDLRLAMLEARASQDTGDSRNAIERIHFNANDFPWLPDMQLLALAAVDHEEGDEESERDKLQAFFDRQALLFEPYHAWSFGILDYQERAKELWHQWRHV